MRAGAFFGKRPLSGAFSGLASGAFTAVEAEQAQEA
jgi:hypothetical protein